MVDFVAEWTPSSCPARAPGGPVQLEPEKVEPVFTEPYWTLFFDGSSRNQGSGAGVLLLSPQGEEHKYMAYLGFKATNNMAEYKSLIHGLEIALELGIRQLLANGDSQLIVKQVKGECCCNDPQLTVYLTYI